MRATKFELVIKHEDPKTLGLTVPPNILAKADALAVTHDVA